MPTIACTLIAKNEEHNLPILLKSIEGCFDEIHLTDTGSTDNTVGLFLDIAKDHEKRFGTKFYLHHFNWIEDFSAARNFALDKISTDYWMWMDLDDSLDNPEGFKIWKNTAMEFFDFWYNNYHYALDDKGNPVVTFMRERVIKTSLGLKFGYFIHEGVSAKPDTHANFAVSWSVKHRRTKEDLAKDKGRNLRIMEKNRDRFDSRMLYYYGKELFENGDPEKALPILLDAITKDDLAPHDRIMGYQYAAYSMVQKMEKLKPEHQPPVIQKIIETCHLGLQLEPTRPEFYTLIGDCYLRLGRMYEAEIFFLGAKALAGKALTPVYGPAAHSEPASCTDYPRVQLSKIYFNTNRLELAKKEIDECVKLYPTEMAIECQKELSNVAPILTYDSAEPCDDIVITTPPQTAYEWDSSIYKYKGMGGSETAAIEVSKWLRAFTGRPVKIFNPRQNTFKDEDGVEYIPVSETTKYFAKYKPALHLAWRHNFKLTNAPTYLWCHDLTTQTVEFGLQADKILCLSEFHKRYVMSMQNVPEDRIIVWRNGIVPEKFAFKKTKKDPNKVVWLSSPDRGLDRAMLVMDEMRKEMPELKLHVYYGMDNLKKFGLAALADKLQKMMKERDWVVYHGFTEQSKMMFEVSDAVMWLHPCDFIETFCITALEALCNGIYPLTRHHGALQNTLDEAQKNGMATLMKMDCITPEEILAWSKEGLEILRERRWERVSVDPEKYSWQNVTRDLVKILNISPIESERACKDDGLPRESNSTSDLVAGAI